jgi:hypothetical protein
VLSRAWAGFDRRAPVDPGTPAVIDLCAGQVPSCDARLQPILSALARWKPRICEYEADYELSLVRHMRRALPDASVDRQHPVRDGTGRLVGKIDVVLSKHLAVELKRGMTAGDADRAVGQVWKYLDAWDRGPVLLVLCETREDFGTGQAARHIGELRRQGKPVFVVAAGRRVS